MFEPVQPTTAPYTTPLQPQGTSTDTTLATEGDTLWTVEGETVLYDDTTTWFDTSWLDSAEPYDGFETALWPNDVLLSENAESSDTEIAVGDEPDMTVTDGTTLSVNETEGAEAVETATDTTVDMETTDTTTEVFFPEYDAVEPSADSLPSIDAQLANLDAFNTGVVNIFAGVELHELETERDAAKAEYFATRGQLGTVFLNGPEQLAFNAFERETGIAGYIDLFQQVSALNQTINNDLQQLANADPNSDAANTARNTLMEHYQSLAELYEQRATFMYNRQELAEGYDAPKDVYQAYADAMGTYSHYTGEIDEHNAMEATYKADYMQLRINIAAIVNDPAKTDAEKRSEVYSLINDLKTSYDYEAFFSHMTSTPL
ncbi:MAG: hypothetical protein KC476_00605 [Cyanobacteria bacterium HKST-UBA06]|nr:hypothetical protein [Cyanobacteria bacterium HKST-UBA06]